MGEVVLAFGPLGIAASIAGVAVSSLIADRLDRRHPGAGRLYTIAAGVLISAPCAAIAFLARDAATLYITLVVGVFFNVWYIGPILAALHDVVPPRLRATATGAYFLLIHLLGDACSPVIVGKIGEATGSLANGLLLATGLMACSGFAALAALPASRRVARLKHSAAAQ
jgi:MFS family permease